MHFLLQLFIGFTVAVIGIIPPGLINMTAAKVNLKEGKKNAYWFVLGVIIVIFIQTYLAVLFARIINIRPDIIAFLREVGFVIFSFMTFYFFWIAKKPKIRKTNIEKKSKRKRFFLGVLFSALNFFPIPYYVFISITLSSYGLFSFDTPSIITFVFGVLLGSSFVFHCYIVFFKKIENKVDYLLRNMNAIIGSITGVISIATLFNILQYYFGK